MATDTGRRTDQEPLLSSGAFARRSWLWIEALRLYERVGLLEPAEVGATNGYRRYRESQLATARLIAMLRRLDMPLAHIREVVRALHREAFVRITRAQVEYPQILSAYDAVGQ